jgi:Flp pilus assembly protein TadG
MAQARPKPSWRRRVPRRLWLRRAAADTSGAAAIEFAFIAGFLSLALLNATDLARYLFIRTALENATQAAAQAAWQTCDTLLLPATTNCPGLNAAITSSIQSSALGSQATLNSGSPSEGYYCVNGSGTLVYVSAVSSKPADCSSVGNASSQPGDYITIQTSYSYTPLFPTISVTSSLPTPITTMTLMRLG